MNWIKSILFLLTMLLYYYGLGTYVLQTLNYKIEIAIRNVIAGFICTYFLGFIVGFPAQYFHINYYLYKYIMLFVLLLVGVFVYIKLKVYFMQKITNIRQNYKSMLWEHCKRYWFIYMMAAIFSIFSMTNSLPYYRANYDDHYYIGKVVQLVGANQLMMENYFNGSLTLAGADISRLINTFELTYGFFGDVFTIGIPFFCRGTMTIHNYLLVFTTYKAFASNFVDEEYSQFVITPMILFLIPSGYFLYSEEAFMRIKLYDGWQFQTAMFYGGSIIRTSAIPLIFIFGKEIIKKLEFKKLIFLGIMYITLLSFSTIFLIYAIMLTICFFIVKSFYYYLEQSDTLKKWIGIVGVAVTIILVVVANEWLANNFVDKQALSDYGAFINEYFWPDFIVRYGLFAVIPAYYIAKGKANKMLVLVIILLYLAVYTEQFRSLLVAAAMNYNFVVLRLMTSICIMMVLFFGIFIARLYCHNNVKQVFTIGLSTSLAVATMVFMYTNKGAIMEHVGLSTGITSYGYSARQILDNDELVPDVIVEVGEYFNTLEYGNYYLLAPEEFTYNLRNLISVNFVMASNRLETCFYNGCNEISQEEINAFNKFLDNKIDYESVQYIIETYDIDYVFTTRQEPKEILENDGFIVVLSSTIETKEYYLLEKR